MKQLKLIRLTIHTNFDSLSLSPNMEPLVYISLSLILALYFFTKHFLRRLKNLPPSPFPTLPILGHLYLLKKPLHRTLAKVSTRYGPIVLLRFGSRQVLLVSSPGAAEECFTKNDVIFANRPRLLAGEHMGYNYSTLAWAPYGDHWRNLRRIAVVEIFAAHRLQMLSEIRADEVKSLIRRLFRNYGKIKIVNMKSAFFEMMLNVMMRMIAGKSFYGDKVVEVEEARRFQDIVEETFRLSGNNLVDFLPILRRFGSFEKKLIALQERRNNFMQGLIDEIRKMKKESDYSNNFKGKEKAMVDVLLSLQETEGNYYTDETIKGIMLVMLSAGSDTSVGTMEWALSLLLNHPHILQKAQKEIDEKVGQARLIDESDLAHLPYLRCVINESMRTNTVAPLLVPHESAKECTVGGYFIPRGTMLLVNMWAIQNSPQLWDNHEEFRPERFKTSDGYKDGFNFLPFGLGRRSCPGEGLALRMIGLALGSVIQCFDWERPSEDMIDMSEGSGLTVPKARPLEAICRPRPTMANLLSQI